MNGTHSPAGYKQYWVVWGILLTITSVMLAAEFLSWSKTFVIGLLLAAMMLKAFLIGGQFMHLRFEKPGLVLAVAGAILFLSAFLFILISRDALRILRMVQP
jgi:caa(3)-type oxidase subunit IV